MGKTYVATYKPPPESVWSLTRKKKSSTQQGTAQSEAERTILIFYILNLVSVKFNEPVDETIFEMPVKK